MVLYSPFAARPSSRAPRPALGPKQRSPHISCAERHPPSKGVPHSVPRIERRQQLLFEPTIVVGMRVPVRHGVIHLATPVNGDQPHARLDEPPSQQQTLAVLVPAVTLAQPHLLAAQLEGPSC